MTAALAAFVIIAALIGLLLPRRARKGTPTTEEEEARARLLGYMERMSHEAHQVRRRSRKDKSPSSRLEREWRHPDSPKGHLE